MRGPPRFDGGPPARCNPLPAACEGGSDGLKFWSHDMAERVGNKSDMVILDEITLETMVQINLVLDKS